MPYTQHGYWVGPTHPSAGDIPPPYKAKCGGPALCHKCAVEAQAAGHSMDRDWLANRRRYATREELAELLAPWLGSLDERFPDCTYQNVDVVRTVLDALGEMGAPVDSLLKITVQEPAAAGTEG